MRLYIFNVPSYLVVSRMTSFQEKFARFVEKGLNDGVLTLDDYNLLMEIIEASGKVTTIHPMLYAGLLNDMFEALPKWTQKAEKEVSKLEKTLKLKGLGIYNVDIDENLWKLDALSADASSCPLPIGMMNVAFISAMALREGSDPIIIRDLITVSHEDMGKREFKFFYQVQAEALIPAASIKHIKLFGKPNCVVIDGPLSASLLIRKVPYRRGLSHEVYQNMQNKAYQLIRLRDQLIKLCYEMRIPIFSIVKRCTSRHFLAWYDLKDVCPYTDQFIFHQLLDYGQRTESISISKAIEKQGAETYARFNDIYGFYIKTSKNPLTPPIRVEYPEYLVGKEEWIAKYVLTTSLTTYEAEFDGLPKAICLVHKDAKITKVIMKEIYKRAVTRILDENVNVKLLGSLWGFSLE